MGEADHDAAVIGGGRGGAGAGAGGGGGWVPVEAASGGSSSSLFSTTSSLTDEYDDEATSSPPAGRGGGASSSSSSLKSSESATTQADGAAAAGPLDKLSTMLEDLPAIRTGLSKYYQGRSQSFTSLAVVTCVEDLAKKTIPHARRSTTARRGYTAALGVRHRLPKTATRGAPGHQLCRGRGAGPAFRGSGRPPPADQGKREAYRF